MNMRYGSRLNPKWMVDALWRKRKVIFFAISAVSLAWNVVVLTESLGIHKTLLNSLSRLLLQLRGAGELLVQRPVVYMLLNLITLIMVVKSGMLGGGRKQVHEAGRADKSVPIFDEAHGHEQAFVSMRRRSSAVFFAYTEPALHSNVSFEPALAGKPSHRARRQPTKQASLFTIEPLDSHSMEPRSFTFLSAGPIVDGAQQPADIRNPISVDTSPPNISGNPLSIDTAHPDNFGRHSTKNGFSPVSHENPPPPQNGTPLDSHENHALAHSSDSGPSDDYDLNKQEFNERVETFITKFKRNLTMQRQDSFNRLLGLVGVGQKR